MEKQTKFILQDGDTNIASVPKHTQSNVHNEDQEQTFATEALLTSCFFLIISVYGILPHMFTVQEQC